jgi:hypothetical protein
MLVLITAFGLFGKGVMHRVPIDTSYKHRVEKFPPWIANPGPAL